MRDTKASETWRGVAAWMTLGAAMILAVTFALLYLVVGGVESAGDFAARNTDKTREVFLADLSGAQPSFRQITDQTTVDIATTDFNFLPSINGAGTVITFSSVLNLVSTDPHDLPSSSAAENPTSTPHPPTYTAAARDRSSRFGSAAAGA